MASGPLDFRAGGGGPGIAARESEDRASAPWRLGVEALRSGKDASGATPKATSAT